MTRFFRYAWLGSLLLLGLAPTPIQATESDTTVRGTIRGTPVTLAHATYGDQLALFAGDHWGSSSSVVIFLFREDRDLPAGEVFEVTPEAAAGSTLPHVHCRWEREDQPGMGVFVVMNRYEMSLEFGALEGDELPGRIELSIPGEDTRLTGRFRAKVQQ
jgi:hypothetical protein